MRKDVQFNYHHKVTSNKLRSTVDYTVRILTTKDNANSEGERQQRPTNNKIVIKAEYLGEDKGSP